MKNKMSKFRIKIKLKIESTFGGRGVGKFDQEYERVR